VFDPQRLEREPPRTGPARATTLQPQRLPDQPHAGVVARGNCSRTPPATGCRPGPAATCSTTCSSPTRCT
jgi:hypothetical protein